MMSDYKYFCDDLFNISNDIFSELGSGFNEAVYQNALGIEFRKRNIKYLKEAKKISDYQIKNFWDEDKKGFYFYDKNLFFYLPLVNQIYFTHTSLSPPPVVDGHLSASPKKIVL